MATADSAQVSGVLEKKFPRSAMPVALVVDAASIVGCTGIIVDAKDADAEQFYGKYDFVMVSAEGWAHRMLLPVSTARAAFDDQ